MIKVRVFSLGFLTFIIIGAFYLFQTKSGYDRLENIMESYISNKVDNNIDIIFLDIESYPKIRIKLKINGVINLYLYGVINIDTIDMNYHLWGDSLEFDNISLKEKYNFFGTLKGRLSNLKIKGFGKIFNGDIKYSFTKTQNSIGDIIFYMSEVKSNKLLSFLGKEPIVETLLDINGTFSSFENFNKTGEIKIHSYNGNINVIDNNISMASNMIVDFNKTTYRYRGDIFLDIASIHIENGLYNGTNKIVDFDYNLSIEKIDFFDKLSEFKIKDDLTIDGKLTYYENDKTLKIDGLNNMFKGDILLHYENSNLTFKLRDVSLVDIFSFLSYSSPFDGDVYGDINLNIKDKLLLMNLKLNRLYFLESKFTKNIYDSLSVDILKINFSKTKFYCGYKNSIFHSTLKIDDGIKNHIFLEDTTLNILDDKIDSNLEMRFNKKEIIGKINGRLDNPKFIINKRIYIKHQVKKAFGG